MNDLQANLNLFCGSEEFFKHPLFPKFVYTEGIRYLARTAECYWLLEYIFSHQISEHIRKQEFQVWHLVVSDSKSAQLTVLDGNNNHVTTFSIEYTDFPLKEIKLWFIGYTLLLPNEY